MDYSDIDDKDFDNALEIICASGNVDSELLKTGFFKAYLFSNENLVKSFKNLDLKNKKVATVGSSGDQLLNCLYAGSKDVLLFDVNPFFEPFVDLKIAAIKSLSYEKFLNYFLNFQFGDYKIYGQISHNLNERSRIFWDNLFLNIDMKELENLLSNFILGHRIAKIMVNGSAFYRDGKSYNKLKEILNRSDCKIRYLTTDLKDFSDRTNNEKFDCILISNIPDHINSKIDLKTIINSLLENSVSKNGKIQFVSFFKKDKDYYLDMFADKNIEFYHIGAEKNESNLLKLTKEDVVTIEK